MTKVKNKGFFVYFIKLWLVLLIVLIGCTQSWEVNEMEMNVTSEFDMNGKIPEKYTCDGEEVNPPIYIEGIPVDAESLVLIMDDPDAPVGTFDHWIVWNIEPGNIEENSVPGVQGKNSFGKTAYGGPCPPSGEHRYFFKLYALDTKLDLPEGSDKEAVEKAMEGHVVEMGELIGLYSR